MSVKRSFQKLQKAALAYPEAYAESPWGHVAIKVRNKSFVFLGENSDKTHSLSVKLPHTNLMAVSLDFAEPTHYGMGKHGWVTARFSPGEDVPVELLTAWLDESFRAVAPKKVVATLEDAKVAKKEKKTKTKKAKKKRAKVLLVGEDPLRLERAVRALGEHGFTVTTADHEGLAKLRRRTFGFTVFDLGRRAVAGLGLASEHAESGAETTILLTGVRDAKFEKRAKAELGGKTVVHRRAPGDPTTVAALVRRMGRAT